jgi:hypothetical protein
MSLDRMGEQSRVMNAWLAKPSLKGLKGWKKRNFLEAEHGAWAALSQARKTRRSS